MKVDYIIVGSGLGGIAFSHILSKNQKSHMVFDDDSQHSSTVAGGLYNPVVLKRFTPVWMAQEQLDLALPFYKEIEERLRIKLDYKTPVMRLFASVEEQNNWFQACDKSSLSNFLAPEIQYVKNKSIVSNYGYGKVLGTGRIDTELLVDSYRSHLKKIRHLRNESFEYIAIQHTSAGIIYKDIEAKYLVFAEGFGLKRNPFFNTLPLKGTKGELLTIHAPDLKIDFVLKSSVFLIPLGNDLYRVGATYEWEDKTNQITAEGREELVTKLKTFLKCDFEIVDQVAGMRPTVIDRRPLIGEHAEHKNLYVLNGLGTRGVMIAPYVADQLFNYIENKQELAKEISIERFH